MDGDMDGTREITAEGLADEPYAKVMDWMGSGLKLKGDELMAFALIWERSHPSGPDSARIDAGYLAAAAGKGDPMASFTAVRKLIERGVVRPAFGGGSLLGEPVADDEAIVAALTREG